MSQNNSWNKPKTPTNPNSGWGDDGLVDVSNWGVPPNKPTVRKLSSLFFAKIFPFILFLTHRVTTQSQS